MYIKQHNRPKCTKLTIFENSRLLHRLKLKISDFSGMNAMYGGVATPLAMLLHSEQSNSRPSMMNRSTCRDDNYNNSLRSAMRLPPLKQTVQRQRIQGQNKGCEIEPLLPSMSFKSRNCKVSHQDDTLPPPPLPPHKNTYHQYSAENTQVKFWNSFSHFLFVNLSKNIIRIQLIRSLVTIIK